MTAQKVIAFIPEKCTACRYCEIACSYVHHGKTDFTKTNIFGVFDQETGERAIASCQHCEDPFCLAACPVDAITKNLETGLVRINPMKCIGCKSCILACPLKVIWFDERNLAAMKCDFCDGDPLCVKYCSPAALLVVERENMKKHLRHECLDEAVEDGGEV